MDNYTRYNKYLFRSAKHIFNNLLKDDSLEEVYEPGKVKGKKRTVSIKLDGTMSGELIISIPNATLESMTKKIVPGHKSTEKRNHEDVAGELANQICGTFVNQLQFMQHNVYLSAPEFDEPQVTVRALYQNINLSMTSTFGEFEIDLYYQDED